MPTFYVHGANDSLFTIPTHGINAANAWAGCDGCQSGAGVVYIQNADTHGIWPKAKNDEIISFIERF